MLTKRYVSNASVNTACLLIFKDQKEILNQQGYYPKNLPKITEDKIQSDSSKDIEEYLDRVEKIQTQT